MILKSNKVLILPLLFSVILVGTAYSSSIEYNPARYLDCTGDLTDEIIIKAKHEAGSNHYIEDIRIFQDKYPHLDLVFEARTLDRTFDFEKEMSKHNCDIVSTVEFAEPDLKKGTRDIIVKTKEIYYKDDENKVVDRTVPLETKVYKWNGKSYMENALEDNFDYD